MIALAAVAGLANVLGALLVVGRRRAPASLDRFLAFGAGFLLAVALLEVIPEALEAGNGVAPWVVAGFMVPYFTERLFLHRHLHHHGGEGEDPCCPPPARAGWAAAAMGGMALHTFLDGVSVSAGLAGNLATAVSVFAAVLLHKVPDGLVIAALVMGSGGGRGRALAAAAGLGVATLAGAVFTATYLGWAQGVVPGLLAFAAGVFIYVAASDLIPEVRHSRERGLPAFLVLGIATAFLVLRFLASD